MNCPEPVLHDFKVPPIRWRWQINVRQHRPPQTGLSITEHHSAALSNTGYNRLALK
jgi:hypothetical protein